MPVPGDRRLRSARPVELGREAVAQAAEQVQRAVAVALGERGELAIDAGERGGGPVRALGAEGQVLGVLEHRAQALHVALVRELRVRRPVAQAPQPRQQRLAAGDQFVDEDEGAGAGRHARTLARRPALVHPGRVEVGFPRGRLWYGEGPEALGSLASSAAIDAGAWLEQRLPRPGAAPATDGFAALRSACHTASGGSYLVLLGAALRGADDGCLSVQVAVDRDAEVDRFDRVLAERTLAGACAAASAIAGAGVLRFAWARVHPVDCKPRRYEQAARVLTCLLGQALAALPPEEVERRAAALWQGA